RRDGGPAGASAGRRDGDRPPERAHELGARSWPRTGDRRPDRPSVGAPGNMTAPTVPLAELVGQLPTSPPAPWMSSAPWDITSRSEDIVRDLLGRLAAAEFVVSEEIAIHRTATVEAGAVLKGPLILGPRCFVASGAYL